MPILEHSIRINAPVDIAETIASDINRMSEWIPGVVQVEPDDLYPEPGSKLNMVYKIAGVTFDFTSTIMESKQGQTLTEWVDGIMAGTLRWEYLPEDGGTRVKVNFDYEMAGGMLGKAIDRLVMKGLNLKNLQKTLDNLKVLVESSVN